MKILIVDDSRTIRTALAQLVTKMGYSVAIAADGGEAVELFENERPDLV